MTYGLAAWFVYVALWYFGIVGDVDGVERIVGGLPVIGGPIVYVYALRNHPQELTTRSQHCLYTPDPQVVVQVSAGCRGYVHEHAMCA